MPQGLHYFLFNKPQDYLRGYMEHMDCSQKGIRPEKGSAQKAVFFSRILDSRQEQMDWHRLTMEFADQREGLVKVRIYASDQRYVVYQGKRLLLDELVCAPFLQTSERIKEMEPFLKKTAIQETDILLHQVSGRYLWLAVELFPQNGACSFLNKIKVSFPRQSWIFHLPEIYQKEDRESGFLERYLALFQTMYEDLNDGIQESYSLFDMEITGEEYLRWLAGWLAIDQHYLWSGEKLRSLLKNGLSFYKRRGTRQGMMDFLTLYTGEKPCIVEYFQLEAYKARRDYFDLLTSLYGSRGGMVSILVRDQVVSTTEQYKLLTKIIEEMKPAHIKIVLTVLKPYLFLSGHSYLGVNSVLGRYGNLVLDGTSMAPFLSVGKTALS